jgi:hypothetical protein
MLTNSEKENVHDHPTVAAEVATVPEKNRWACRICSQVIRA